MGIHRDTIYLIDEGLSALGISYGGLKMCELGNQKLKGMGSTSKKHFTSLGVEHVSIDLNGRDGSVTIDLSKPTGLFREHFDMVTNYGTSEHVLSQYEVFRNAHFFTRIGGVMIHFSPHSDSFPGHGFFGYRPEFFLGLAEASSYDVVLNELSPKEGGDKLFIRIIFRKRISDFIKEEEFRNIPGLVKR